MLVLTILSANIHSLFLLILTSDTVPTAVIKMTNVARQKNNKPQAVMSLEDARQTIADVLKWACLDFRPEIYRPLSSRNDTPPSNQNSVTLADLL